METKKHMHNLCETIPPNDVHAVSVSLPTWKSNLQWARKSQNILARMRSGYPRFFVHSLVQELADHAKRLGPPGVTCLPFSTAVAAADCCRWIAGQVGPEQAGAFSMTSKIPLDDTVHSDHSVWVDVHLVWVSPQHYSLAKAFWQHTGEGISSRRALACLRNLESLKYGSNCGIKKEITTLHSSAYEAKRFVRAQLASYLSPSAGVRSERDIFLYASGMKAIYDTFRAVLGMQYMEESETPTMVAYGFLYVDTFKIMSRFGCNQTLLYGHGTPEELDQLKSDLEAGKRICALFTELPTNPLLTCVDLRRIRRLADQYGFVVVCDDTVGTSVNVDILSYVDVLVTSLTKLFSGACNVMGGSVVVNPMSRHHELLTEKLGALFVDSYYPEDALVMAQNCADFDVRIDAINANAEALASLLSSRRDLVKQVYYPSMGRSRAMYDTFRRPGRGYGYLVTIEFNQPQYAIVFFDNLDVAKGPSLGTNFTLACPYTLLGHYGELDWAAKYGVVEHLVRISVGMEDDLIGRVEAALQAVDAGRAGCC
ncbi:hypothetical protein JX265_005495 [Neoarthrinium moseri]|uniref:Cystathionine gamma-synthase n=1 Tax=Neoarthrinium moseri TaxID=1658444 RepID=A0A9Q0ARD1_9PEZI|nr:hypothetical protein JX265_005495 [Neoarthrinium moseri]